MVVEESNDVTRSDKLVYYHTLKLNAANLKKDGNDENEIYVMQIWKFKDGHPKVDILTKLNEKPREFKLEESPHITFHLGRGQVIFGKKGKMIKQLNDLEIDDPPKENPTPFEESYKGDLKQFSINLSPCKRFYERTGTNGLFDAVTHRKFIDIDINNRATHISSDYYVTYDKDGVEPDFKVFYLLENMVTSSIKGRQLPS
jgi:hypothetical protein